jgi:superfamily II DNA helicase RecQ
MHYRLLDLRFCPKRGVIDDEPLQRLLHGHRVLSVREHFYTHDDIPHVVLAVSFALGETAGAASVAQPAKQAAGRASTEKSPSARRREDWREILDDGNQALFETLRTWRSARARTDAVPPYVILTNAQLAHVANARPTSLAGLRQVKGLGDGRVTGFGQALLAVIETGVVPEPIEATEREATP